MEAFTSFEHINTAPIGPQIDDNDLNKLTSVPMNNYGGNPVTIQDAVQPRKRRKPGSSNAREDLE